MCNIISSLEQSDTSLTSSWATTVHKAWKLTGKKMNKKDKNFSFAQEIQRAAQEQSQGKKLLIQPQAPGSSPLRPQSISVWIVPNSQKSGKSLHN